VGVLGPLKARIRAIIRTSQKVSIREVYKYFAQQLSIETCTDWQNLSLDDFRKKALKNIISLEMECQVHFVTI